MHYLVPAQWGGSVEHFYHFLLGYLYPLTRWLAEHPGARPVARDCGPMNPWFGLIPGRRELRIVPAGTMLHRLVRGAPATVLPADDDPETFDPAELARFREAILSSSSTVVDGVSHVTFLERGRSDPYYATPTSEQRHSGAFRRNVPNGRVLAAALNRTWPTAVVDTAELSPAEQVRLLAGTNVLIGQHGAGLANMIWMAPGSAVVEVLPPMPGHLAIIFRNLAIALGHQYVAIPQDGPKTPVSQELLATAVSTAVGAPAR